MGGWEGRAVGWLLHTAVGGGLLLLVGRVLAARTRAVARRQRLGEWSVTAALVLAALSLGPAWLPLSLPRPAPADRDPSPADGAKAPAPAEAARQAPAVARLR